MDLPAFHIIAHIENDFTAKFAIPRQSGLVDSVISRIVFTPEYRNETALRGMLAPVGFLPGHSGALVSYSLAATAGRQNPHGRLCHPLSLPSQSHRSIFCAASRD